VSRRYGHIADPAGHRATSASRLVGGAPIPASHDCAPSGPGVLDQQQTSSCVGHASITVTYTALKLAGKPINIPSPVWAYLIALCVDRPYSGVGKPTKLVDQGSMPNQAVRGFEEFGLLDQADKPLDEATLLEEPTLDQFEKASRQRIIGWRRIDSVGQQRVNDVCAAIAMNRPPMFAVEVDQAFEDNTGSILGKLNGATLGGHMLASMGYETSASGKKLVKFQNSWSTQWGRGGFGYGDENFIARMSDIYVPGIEIVSAL